MGTAVPAALLSCPLRRCIDTDSAGEDVGSGGAHELVGPGAESSAERRSGQRSWALWSGHHAQLDRGWCLELAEPILQVLEIFFFLIIGIRKQGHQLRESGEVVGSLRGAEM